MSNEEREALIAQGWTPPVAVDPDLVEAQQIFSNSSLTTPIGMTLTGIKRGRELERAVMGNPIPEQIQEVKPTVAVDPDLAEAAVFENRFRDFETVETLFLQAIKRGRALAAEAKPGMVWVKHDGAAYRPASPGAWVTTRNKIGGYISYSTKIANDCDWSVVTHYAIITPPEDAA